MGVEKNSVHKQFKVIRSIFVKEVYKSGILTNIKRKNRLTYFRKESIIQKMEKTGKGEKMERLEGYTQAQADMLRLVFDQGQVSRAQLANTLQVSNLTVINGVKKLLEEGALIESGILPSERGRHVTLLSVNPERYYFLCVDIGASSTKLAVVSFNGTVIHREQLLHVDRDARKVYVTPALLREHMDTLLHSVGLERFYALCFSISGTVDYQNKKSCYCANIQGWNDVDFQKEFGDFFRMPVYLDSSGHCSALAERQFGQGRDAENLMFVSVGSSICTGIVLGGELLRGVSGAAGELGHTQVDVEPPLEWICTCGRRNCLEMYCTMPVIRTVARKKYRKLDPKWPLPEANSDAWLRSCYALQEGPVLEAVQEAAQVLGNQIANAANILNPQMIALGGGTIHAFPEMVDIVRQQIRERSLPIISDQLTVTHSQLGADVALRGAALLAIYDLIDGCVRKTK